MFLKLTYYDGECGRGRFEDSEGSDSEDELRLREEEGVEEERLMRLDGCNEEEEEFEDSKGSNNEDEQRLCEEE